MVSSKTIDYDFAIKCYNMCDEFGLDTVSTARCIAFAIELYEKGILKKNETDGMHLEWNNKDIVFSLIEKIARREGIGDILANGVYEAAVQIGRGAEDYAHHIKKMELIPAASSLYAPYFALTLAISDKADATRNMSYPVQETWFLPRGKREEFIKSGFFPYPKGYEKYFMTDFDFTGEDYEGSCQFAVYDEETFSLTDCLGLCNFWSIFFPYPPINGRPLLAELISGATGLDIDESELTQISRRVINLVRAYNLRSGLTRKSDTIPKMFFTISPSPPWSKLDPDIFDRCLDRFYELRGWNNNGVPKKEELDKLGLDDVRQELERRGIL
jgi:aldehyde:ferredoxin oxidoreductase